MTIRRRFLAKLSSLVLVLASLVFVGPSASATTYTIDCSVNPATFAADNPATYVQNPNDTDQYVWYVEYSGLQAQSPTVEIQNCTYNASSSSSGSWWSSGSKTASIGISDWADVQGYGYPGQTKYKIVFYNYSYQPEFSTDVVYEGESFSVSTNSPYFQFAVFFADGIAIDGGYAGDVEASIPWSTLGGEQEVTLTLRVYDCEVGYDAHCPDDASVPTYDFQSAFMGETTLTYAPAGVLRPSELQPVPYVGPVVTNDPETAQSGSTVTYQGSDLDEVTSATIAGQTAAIVSKSAGSLTLRVPAGLSQGMHDVILHYSTTESLTLQNGLVVQDLMKVWTQLQSDNTVKMYAKNIIGEGKIQFFHNNNEIAWVRASNALNPKLRQANGSSYLVRTRELVEGKNAFEIYLNGTRIWRAAYSN